MIFFQNELVGNILRKHYEDNRLVAAICAGPTAFFGHKLAFGKRITSYPSFKEKLGANYVYSDDRVVQDGNLITVKFILYKLFIFWLRSI